MTTPDVSVIVVTFNSEQVLRDCVSALRLAFPRHEIELIVVDNASHDASLDVIRSMAGNATIVRNPTNVGFARAVNAGARLAQGDSLMLLNPDAQLAPGAGSTIVEALDRQDRVVAPLFVPRGGRRGVVSAGLAPSVRSMALHYSGLARLGRRVTGHYAFLHQLRDEFVEVDWVSGACLAIRLDTWAELGGLAEDWFMYGEDVDLCLRAQNSGRSVVVATAARVEHEVGSSDGTRSLSANPMWVVNLYAVFRTHFSPGRAHALMWRSVVSAGLAARAVAFALRGWMSRPGARKPRLVASYAFGRYALAVAPWKNPTGIADEPLRRTSALDRGV